ncbi:MAG: pseudouridine synthase [Eubacteriales bacterium]|nr:pseudouridine synthase [Eubacteriales bacterium]
MAGIRLDRFISETMGLSRKEARSFIKSGRVTADGCAVTSPDERVDPEHMTLEADGCVLKAQGPAYIMLNKPAGVLSATEDSRQKTVLDLLPESLSRRGMFPVGRLDKDTTGLLLLTDDGDFAHRVISPKSRVPKLYEAEMAGEAGEEDVRAFADGLILGDGTQCLPARLELLGGSHVRVEVFEGRYHQVRRMLASRGLPVIALKRLRIGALWLDTNLMEGESRLLTVEELRAVFMQPGSETSDFAENV